MFTKALRVLALSLSVALVFAPAIAYTQPPPPPCPNLADNGVCQVIRESRYTLSVTDLNRFTDANVYYEALHIFGQSNNPGSQASQTFNLKTGYQNFVAYGDPGFIFNGQGIDMTATPVSGNQSTIAMTNTGPGGLFTLTYYTPIGPSFAESWITPGVHNGFYTLDFNVGGFGAFGTTPFTYWLNVSLPGDWSSQGIGTGRTEWVGTLPNGYVIDNDFVYDGSSTTRLFVYNNAWDGNSPGAEFRLYGAAVVPEPSTVALLTAGLLALAVSTRRVRRKTICLS